MKEIISLHISTKTELYLFKEKFYFFLTSLEFDKAHLSLIINIILELGWGEISDENIFFFSLGIMKESERYGLYINLYSLQEKVDIDRLKGYFNNVSIIKSSNKKTKYLHVFIKIPNLDFYPTTRFIRSSQFLLGNLSSEQMIQDLTIKNNKLCNQIDQLNIEMENLVAEVESKSMFLAYLGHEIHTPMNGILGFTEILLKEALHKKQYDYLNKIRRSSYDLLNIVDDVRDFSKIEAGKLMLQSVPFNLSSIIDELGEYFFEQAENKGLKFKIETKVNDCNNLIGDPLRLKQVLINITSNAIKFTIRGSVIIVVEFYKQKQEKVYLQFKVTDTGIGIRERIIEKLFSPFTQADGGITKKFGGIGLGLYICKKLVGLMGGNIEVESFPEKGSKFSFILPFTIDNKFMVEKIRVDFKGLRALIVDPYLIGSQVIAETLTNFGIVCKSIPFSKQVIRVLHSAFEKDRPYDLVIINFDMPFGMNGGQTANIIKINRELSNTKVIITGTNEHEIQYYDKYIDAFLKKPIFEIKLLETINKLFVGSEKYNNINQTIVDTDISYYKDQLRGCEILLADDSVIYQEVVRELLSGVGIKLIVADNGRQAIEKVKNEYWDAVLLDMNIPEIDEIMASIEIKQHEKNSLLPIIAMIANIEDKENFLSAGITDYITKPFAPKDLYTILLKWILPTKKDILPSDTMQIKSNDKNETDIDFKQLTLSGINVDDGLKRVNANTQVYRGLLINFRQNYLTLKRDFEKAYIIRDIGKAKRYIHTLKGAGGTIGATKLYMGADEFERAITRNDFDLDDKKDLFFIELDKILNALSVFVKDEKQVGKSEVEKEIEQKEFIPILNQLKNNLDHDIGQAINYCDRLLDILENTIYEDDFKTISDDVYEFNIENAKTKLQKMLKKFHL